MRETWGKIKKRLRRQRRELCRAESKIFSIYFDSTCLPEMWEAAKDGQDDDFKEPLFEVSAEDEEDLHEG